MNMMQLAVANLLVTTRPPVADSHKHCKRCGEDRLKTEFRVKSNGHLNHTCTVCLPPKVAAPKPKLTDNQRTCRTCGKGFTIANKHSSKQKFCSPVCRQTHVNKVAADLKKSKHRPRKCMCCGETFLSGQPKQINCSEECSRRYFKILAREKSLAPVKQYQKVLQERIESRAAA